MKVSAVGFLFQNNVNQNGLKGKNYTCIIHKKNSEGNFNRNVISSPLIKESRLDIVTPQGAEYDVEEALETMTKKDSPDKFIGATVKDGIKETEIHSLISDKLFAVRTKDENGKNHFRLMGKNNTKALLKRNLNIVA